VRTIEQDKRLPAWLNWLLNHWPLCLDMDGIRTVAVAWDADGVYMPGARSLFYNGFVMVRLVFPFGVWLHVKPARDHRLQMGLGWKLNGRFGVTLRWQTDASAAAGVSGPNYGQASAWARGTA
jgi:hypothetical protein